MFVFWLPSKEKKIVVRMHPQPLYANLSAAQVHGTRRVLASGSLDLIAYS
jgi:hypothetical protein